MCAQQGDFTLINLIMKPCFFKLVSNYNEGKKRKKNHREGKEVKVRDVDRSQSREAVVGGGVTFLSCVVPQLGSHRVRLEPNSPQYLGQRGAPAPPPPLSGMSPLSLCVVSPALDCPKPISFHEMWARRQDRRGTGRTQTEQLASFCPQRPPSRVSFALNQA